MGLEDLTVAQLEIAATLVAMAQLGIAETLAVVELVAPHP